MAKEFEKSMNAMPPHPRRHGVFRREATECPRRRGVLRCQEEVVVLVQQCPGERNGGLKLPAVESACPLIVVYHLYAFGFDHDQAGIDALDFGNQLLLRNGTGLGLLNTQFWVLWLRDRLLFPGRGRGRGRGRRLLVGLLNRRSDRRQGLAVGSWRRSDRQFSTP